MATSEVRQTETIGRLPHLLTHVESQLPALAGGADTFEEIRQRYGRTMALVAARGQGRVTAPRAGVGAAHRYWSSARDLIKELQALGWVEAGIPAPSTKQSVEAHRHRRYPITDEGRRVAALAANRREVADALTDAALGAHPYLRSTLEALADGPIFCPEVSEGQILRLPSRRHWATHVVGLWERSDAGVKITAEQLDVHVADALRRRFGHRADGLRPSPKEIAEAMNDSFADAALAARGLTFGATTLDQLKSWGMELRLLDQSRYVPGHDGGNLIWLACDLRRDSRGTLHARRRTYTSHGAAVGRALVESYLALRDQPSLDSDEGKRTKRIYQPIHAVRAAAAVRTGTAREVGDRALEAMAAGELELGMEVRLLAARYEVPPRSEPMYQRGGTRALILTMTQADNEDT